MISRFGTVVVACGLVACGGNKSNNTGGDDDDTHVDAPMPDAPADASLAGRRYVIPLGHADGQDHGRSHATLTASGKMFLLDLDTGSTTTGIAGLSCST